MLDASNANEPARAERYPASRVLAAFAAVYVVWGSTYLAIRYAVETIPPFLMAGGRFLSSGVLLYAWSRWRGAEKPTKRHWRDAAIAGVLMLCFGNGGVAWAEQRVPSGLAALLVAVVPLWMVLVDWMRPNGRRPTPLVLVGVGVGFLGLVILIGPAGVSGPNAVDKTAALVLVAASLAWACGSVYTQQGDQPTSAPLATGIQMLAGGSMLVLIGLLLGEAQSFHITRISAASWAGWIYLVTFGSLVGFTAYIYLLQAVSPAKASTYAYVNPLVAVFLGWAIAGEPVTRRTIVAAAVILAGVAMITLVKAGGRPRVPRRESFTLAGREEETPR